MLLSKRMKKKEMLVQKKRNSLFSSSNNRIMLKVSSFNLNLKPISEKLRIIDNFGRFLNSLTFPIQIICDSNIINPSDWNLKIHDKEYFEYLKTIIEQKNIVEKTFYLVCLVEDEELNSISEHFIKQLKKCGLNAVEVSKDDLNIVPHLKPGFVKVGDYYYDTVIIYDWPHAEKPGFLESIYNLEKDVTISMFIKPQDNEQAKEYLEKKIVRKSSSAIIKNEDDEYLGDFDEEVVGAINMRNELIKNEGRFFFMSFYITVKNKSYIQLQKDTKAVHNLLKSMMIKSRHAIFRQDDGVRNSLPHGHDYIGADYNFTTTPLKQFFPFIFSNIMDKNGIMIGENLENGSLIFLDHFSYFSSSMLILGKTGSGKSFAIKSQIAKMINQGIEVTVLDTENECKLLKENEKYKTDDNLRIIKKSSIEEYVKYLEEYLNIINESYESNKNFKPRFLVIEEFWTFMKNIKASEIIQAIIKAGRKRWLGICAVTQEVEEVLKSDFSKSLINNCSIKILLKMESSEKKMIQRAFGISENEWSAISTADEGEGILFADSNHVKFKTLVSPKQYKLFTTKPHERILS